MQKVVTNIARGARSISQSVVQMAKSYLTKDKEEERDFTETQKLEEKLEQISPIKDLKCELKEPLYKT